MKNWPNTRDIILFFGGLAGVFNETFLSHAERPTLLILFAAMMGLPAFLRTDDKNQPGPPPQLPQPDPEEQMHEALTRQEAYERELERRYREHHPSRRPQQHRRKPHGEDTE